MDANAQTNNSPWLHRFAVLTVIITFLLLGLGGLVTSHEAGMSVPDWPNSYGYNMFLFPVSDWMGGILYEHTHRLLATFVGLLVVALTRWLGGRPACLPLAIVGALETLAGFVLLRLDPKWAAAGGFLAGIGGVVLLAACVWVRNKPAPGPLPLLGWLAFAGVQLQGLLGGMRVVLSDAQLGIIHGVVGQAFFILVGAIALFTSRFWSKWTTDERQPVVERGLRRLVLLAAILIFVQLMLGATMRGQHAGLAIPDFPTAYHQLWPDTSAAAIARYNADRMDAIAVNPITAFQINLQMVHRMVALAIFVLVAASAWRSWRRLGGKNPLTKLAIFWLALIICQIGLGAWTIWSNKAADVATLHLMGGALALVTGALWCLIAFRRPAALTKIAPAETISGAFGPSPAAVANK
jgi:heme a synthase